MRVFLLDLWLDLREKRLAPVALALLAGVLVIPFALAKSDPEPPPPPPAPTAEQGANLPKVVADARTEGDLGSRLTSFDPRDPFEPTASAAAPAQTGGAPQGGTTTTTGGTPSGGGSTPSGGGSTPSGGGTTPSGGGTPSTGGTTKRITYTFTTDIVFGQFGEEKRYNKVKRLQLIPSEDDPAVVFLGVTTSGKTAVFLVDGRFTVSGDGACKPSRSDCTFVYLRTDPDHNSTLLTDDGDGTVYRLTLRDIDRVAVSAQNQSASGDGSPAFTGSTRDAAPPGEPEAGPRERRSFKSPVFGDDQR
jgi:hypothetical protein